MTWLRYCDVPENSVLLPLRWILPCEILLHSNNYTERFAYSWLSVIVWDYLQFPLNNFR